MFLDSHSSSSGNTKCAFGITYWLFNFESVTKCARSNLISFCLTVRQNKDKILPFASMCRHKVCVFAKKK